MQHCECIEQNVHHVEEAEDRISATYHLNRSDAITPLTTSGVTHRRRGEDVYDDHHCDEKYTGETGHCAEQPVGNCRLKVASERIFER